MSVQQEQQEPYPDCGTCDSELQTGEYPKCIDKCLPMPGVQQELIQIVELVIQNSENMESIQTV